MRGTPRGEARPNAVVRMLTIAGSDSGGGAGIQADLKAFAACGAHGMSAITAVTAQNTRGVQEILPVPPASVVAQIEAVAGDIGVDGVKIGMLTSRETVLAVARSLRLFGDVPVVLDPVMVSHTGVTLTPADAVSALRTELLPLVTVVTPNLREAAELTAQRRPSVGDSRELARSLLRLGPAAVVVTGGETFDGADVFAERDRVELLRGPTHPSDGAHGTGCTHSSVLAARLAMGDTPLDAARVARKLTGQAVLRGLRGLGGGSGPVDVLGAVLPKVARKDPGDVSGNPGAAGRRTQEGVGGSPGMAPIEELAARLEHVE